MRDVRLAFPVILAASLVVGSVGARLEPPEASGLARAAAPQARAGTVVVAAADDSYRSLAREIAAAERATLASDWEAALASRPRFALWVVSPAGLSDSALVAAGRRLQRAGMQTSVGIITGSSVESARALYGRAARASGRRALAVNGEYGPAGIDGPRWRRVPAPGGGSGRDGKRGEDTAWRPTDVASVVRGLARADYVAYTGHGTAVSWRLTAAPGGALHADHVPALRGAVVSAAACQTLRPWVPGSIARSFVDRGAAGYLGFAYSPVAGYRLGSQDGLPLRHTWPGFSVGDVVRVQNLAARKGFAAFPQYWLLGDPRMSLRDSRPYRVEESVRSGQRLRLRLAGVPEGWLPLRVPEGAGLAHVRVVHEGGRVESRRADPLFDSRIQTMDEPGAKLVLVHTPGGRVTVDLGPAGTSVSPALDVLAGSLDHTLILLPRGGGDWIALVLSIPALGVAGRAWRRHGGRFGAVLVALATGLSFGALHALWSLARLDGATITSKPLDHSPIAWVATSLLVAAGSLVWLAGVGARRWRLGAVLLATAPAGLPVLFAGAVYLGSAVLFRTRLPASPYSAMMILPPAVAWVVWATVFVLAALTTRRLCPPVHGKDLQSTTGSP